MDYNAMYPWAKNDLLNETSFYTVEPSGVQVLKNPNPLKDVEASAVLNVVVLV